MYEPGDLIVEAGQRAKRLLVIGKGAANLYGFVTSPRGEKI